MTQRAASRPLLDKTTFVQALVIALGIVLWMTAGKAWIIVAGLGAFVPGILRELGVMHDLDEFQREASRRAAFHAYLVGGLATVCIITALHLGDESVAYPADMVTLILCILWVTWLFSYLLTFWGPQRTAMVVLLAFGSFWALFAILDGASGAKTVMDGVVGVLLHLVFVVPFGVGAWTARRWPRATGWFLVVAGLGLVIVLGKPSAQAWTARLLTLTMLAVPLLASGLGLVRLKADDAAID